MSEELTPEELAEMRRVRDAATEGEWDCHTIGAEGSDFDIFERDHGRSVASAGADDAQFIAKFDPQTVGRMLDEIEDLSESESELLAKIQELAREGKQLHEDATELADELAAKDAEIARLREESRCECGERMTKLSSSCIECWYGGDDPEHEAE